MRIVHCFFTMHTGGSQILCVDMLNYMCKHHDVYLIVVNNQWNIGLLKLLDPKISVHLLNRKEGSRNPFPVLKFNLLLARIHPDVIHCHEDKLINLLVLNRYKTVYTIHDVGHKNASITKYDFLASISEAVREDVRIRFNTDTRVVYNGIPINQFKKRTSYKLSEGEPVRFVQISRLMHKKKGQDVLIGAIKQLASKYKKTNFVVDFIGTGESLDFLKAYSRELEISDYVNFIGERDRGWIQSHLADYHILIQPSRYEGFGLTVVEGVAAGLPIVASNIDGPAEIMKNVDAKFLFKNGDVDDCAFLINRVIELYMNQSMENIMHQYAIVGKTFSIQSTCEAYLSIYKHLN